MCSWFFEKFFTLKSLVERLKRDFHDSKIVFLQFTSKLYVSHLKMLCHSSELFERRKHDSRLAKLFNFHLEVLFRVCGWNMSLRLTRSFLH